MSPAAPALRLAELLGALSLATDLSNGQPHEHGLRTTLLALRLAQDEPMPVRQAVYWTGLLHYLGCVGFAVEEAAFAVGDDIALRRSFEQTDLGRPLQLLGAVLRDLGRGQPLPQRAGAVLRFLGSPGAPRRHGQAVCDAAVHFARKLQLPEAVVQALAATDERFDGSGLPQGLAGSAIPLPQRYFEVARVGAGFVARSGLAHAVAEVGRRAGSHLDPAIVSRFTADGPALAGDLGGEDSVWDELLAAEPGLWLLDAPTLTPAFEALALLADLKSGWLAGHSQAVARLALDAARAQGLNEADALLLHHAALVHDLGRVAVPSGLWDKPGPLSAAEWERVHLHSYTTDRVLRRSATLRPLADIAGRCHERLDGSGYHRGDRSIERPARLLAAADAYAACVADRAHRPALGPAAARSALLHDVAQGRLCAHAVDAVLQAAGQGPPQRGNARLSARELEVLALLVRGLSNKQIGRQLGISPRTVQHHSIHIYDKAGVHSRAGVALWAVDQGLL